MFVVTSEKKTTGYGNRIVINHGGGYATFYAHCDELLALAGDRVEAGDNRQSRHDRSFNWKSLAF